MCEERKKILESIKIDSISVSIKSIKFPPFFASLLPPSRRTSNPKVLLRLSS